jgi:hypothetical protein
VLHGSQWAFAVETPPFVQDGLQHEAVFVARPHHLARWGNALAPSRRSGRLFFFELLLRDGICLHLPRPGFAGFATFALEFALEFDQIDPADLDTHPATNLMAHPLRDCASHPRIAFWRWPTHGLREFRQLLRGEERLRAMRMGVLPIVHPLGAFGVVALGDLPNPLP